MTNSRAKGAAGEREVANLLFAELGMNFKRDLEQYREGDHGDLICEDDAFPFIIEVKRYAKGWTCSSKWEAQAFAAAKRASKHPCVIYRHDGHKWRCRVYIDAVAQSLGAEVVSGVWFDTDILGFCWIAREIMSRKKYPHGFDAVELTIAGQVS